MSFSAPRRSSSNIRVSPKLRHLLPLFPGGNSNDPIATLFFLLSLENPLTFFRALPTFFTAPFTALAYFLVFAASWPLAFSPPL
jgi:hypothetical protein